MPAGLRLADRLAEPMFTPSTKAEEGHDLNIDFDGGGGPGRSGGGAAGPGSSRLALYRRAAARVDAAGFVLADTKFELGYVDGQLSLCDEVVTPDSSPHLAGRRGGAGATPRRPSTSSRCGTGPPPRTGTSDRRRRPLPPEVVRATSERYVAAYERVTGRRLADWYGAAR